MMNSTLTKDYGQFWQEDQILFLTYRKGLFIDLSIAKSLVADRLEHFSQLHHLVCDGRSVAGISREARDYFSSEIGTRYLKSTSFIVKGKILKILAMALMAKNKQ